MIGGAHRAGEAEPVHRDWRRSACEYAGAGGPGIPIEIYENVDLVGSDPCRRLVVGEVINVGPTIDSVHDSLFCLICVIYSAIVGNNLKVFAIMRLRDIAHCITYSVSAQVR